jgi:hypothetical protein
VILPPLQGVSVCQISTTLRYSRIRSNGFVQPGICSDRGTGSTRRRGRLLVSITSRVERAKLVDPIGCRCLAIGKLTSLGSSDNDSPLDLIRSCSCHIADSTHLIHQMLDSHSRDLPRRVGVEVSPASTSSLHSRHIEQVFDGDPTTFQRSRIEHIHGI